MKTRLLPLLVCPLLLTGCLGTVLEIFCDFSPDGDHCYQAAAVQGANPDGCEKIEGKDFGGVSNPPKDKCFLQIAGNTGDPSVCKNIEGGMMSYTEEECLEAAFRGHTVEACKDASDPAACRNLWGQRNGECGEGFTYDSKSRTCKEPSSEGSSSSADAYDDDIENKVETDLNTIKDAAKGKYMELLEGAIEGETDPDKLHGLQAYKEFLEKAGETMENVEMTVEKLTALKRLFLDSYDPSMSIDRMPVSKILADGFFDKVNKRIFGEDPPTERSKAEDALTVYEAMLKRQAENDFLQQGRLSRIGDTVVSAVKDKATETLKEQATNIAEGVGGTAFAVVGIVDKAISSFQEEAQKEMFVGLAAAYNRQRDAIVQANPNLSPEEIHNRTVAQVKEDPYQDNPNSGFIKYGNIIENGDCKDAGNNPLCVDNRVFWTALDKTYVYAHK